MIITILGTGDVGQSIGSKLIDLGHRVQMGSRSTNHEKGKAWVERNGVNASLHTFSDSCRGADLIINCTKGEHSLDILHSIESSLLDGKILIDIANPLDFSKGMPPRLTVCNDDSLGEQTQRTFPNLKVVKTLNTMWCGIMVNPAGIAGGEHVNFLCGNDAEAKNQVKKLLQSMGWKESNLIDLGDISASRGTEMILPLWVRIFMNTQNGAFNFNLVR